MPRLAAARTRVRCAGPAPLAAPGRAPAAAPPAAADEPLWQRLEETLLAVARGAPPMIFRPTTDLYSPRTDAHPIVSQGGERAARHSRFDIYYVSILCLIDISTLYFVHFSYISYQKLFHYLK